MTLYFPKAHYNKNFRGQVFPLLKPFIKGKGFTNAERIALYGVSEVDFSFVDVLEDCDIAILPMAWNYYVQNKLQKQALTFLETTAKHDKQTWVVLLDDYGLDFPDYRHVTVFRANGYSSKLPSWHVGLPVFISDPLKQHYGTHLITQRPYNAIPSIGFCGYATDNKREAFKVNFRVALKNIGYYLKIYNKQPEVIMAVQQWRYRILKQLESQKGVLTNFIYREQYRAGVQTEADRQASTQAFFDNIMDSDYVVCMRGAGNFSVRLYETLAMGRIPVYIHTDDLLPLANSIDWKAHVVWVNEGDIDCVGERVLEFHRELNDIEFKALQHKNRRLWEDKLRLKGFFLNDLGLNK